jgi:hypothetical protein
VRRQVEVRQQRKQAPVVARLWQRRAPQPVLPVQRCEALLERQRAPQRRVLPREWRRAPEF